MHLHAVLPLGARTRGRVHNPPRSASKTGLAVSLSHVLTSSDSRCVRPPSARCGQRRLAAKPSATGAPARPPGACSPVPRLLCTLPQWPSRGEGTAPDGVPSSPSTRAGLQPLSRPYPLSEAWAPQTHKCPVSAEPCSTERLWVTMRPFGGFRWAVSMCREKRPLLQAAKSDSERLPVTHVSVERPAPQPSEGSRIDPGLPGEQPWPREEQGHCACAESIMTPLLHPADKGCHGEPATRQRGTGGCGAGSDVGAEMALQLLGIQVSPHTWPRAFFHESFQTQLRDHFAALFVQLRG